MKKLIIIVLVIGVIICGGLLYLFLDKRASDNAVQTAQDLPLTNETKSSKNAKSQKSESNYLIIKEWNVRFKVSNDLEGARLIRREGKVSGLTTASADRIKGCKDTELVTLSRAKKDEEILYETTAEQLMKQHPDWPEKIGDYYYIALKSSGLCAEYGTKDQKFIENLKRKLPEAFHKTLEGVN